MIGVAVIGFCSPVFDKLTAALKIREVFQLKGLLPVVWTGTICSETLRISKGRGIIPFKNRRTE